MASVRRAPGLWTPGQIPPGPVTVDRTHPLAPYLTLAVAPGSWGVDADRQVFIAPTSNTFYVSSPYGPAIAANGTVGNPSGLSQGPTHVQTGTIIWFGQVVSAPANDYTLVTQNANNGSVAPYYRYGIVLSSTGVVYVADSYSGSFKSTVTTINTTNSLVGKWAQVAITFASGSGSSYLNGNLVDSSLALGSGTLSYTSSDRISFHDSRTGNVQSVYGLFFNKRLSGDEIASLYRDPFAIVRPVKQRRTTLASSAVDSSNTPGAGSLALTGFAPSPSAGAASAPGAGSLAITGYAPTVAASAAATPGTGTLSIAGQAPAVTTSSGTAAPGAGALTFTGYAPTVIGGVAPGAGALTLTGFAPTLSASVALTPGVGAIRFTGRLATWGNAVAPLSGNAALRSTALAAPSASTPLVADESGGPARVWNEFFRNLWVRTGGGSGPALSASVMAGTAPPTSAQLPAGMASVHRNTATGAVRLYYNDGGVMKSVTFT